MLTRPITKEITDLLKDYNAVLASNSDDSSDDFIDSFTKSPNLCGNQAKTGSDDKTESDDNGLIWL